MNKHSLLGYSSLMALALFATPIASAQTDADDANDDELTQDVVVVKGIRGSLVDAASIRRNEAGVVDAITAEDIADFPDANLAESLQRITGVSIDRQDNEGNQISVRGLGPSFNLVTLNGRQLPVASSPDVETLNSATQSRAFNFAEIASESVSAVNVYKTARADISTGGIGATVDIQTSRPFDHAAGDLKAVLSAAGIHDFSTEEGNDVTPEIGGLFSYNYNDVFGVSATASYSRRNFRNELNTTESFDVNVAEFPGDDPSALTQAIAAGTVPAGTDVLFTPRTFITEVGDNRRERTNFQGVFQFRPVNNFTLTADYTLSRFELDEERQETALFNLFSATFGDTSNIVVSENGTAISFDRTGVAFDAIATSNELRVENDSFGLNAKWELDQHTFELDGHLSTAESQPDGQSNDLVAIFQGALGVNVNFTLDPNGGAPTLIVDDSGAFRGEEDFGGGALIPGIDSAFDNDAFSPLGSIGRVLQIENDVSQIQFRGTWHGLENEGVTGINYGVGYIEYDVATRFADFPFTFQGLVPCTGICEADFFTQIDTSSFNGILPVINAFDAQDAIDNVFATASLFPELGDITTVEETFSAYVNTNWEGSIGGINAKLSAGVRFETTDVSSSSEISLPVSISVNSDSEANVNFDPTETTFVEETGGYSNFLPAVDFQLLPTDNTVLRLSYGRTLARPDLNALRPGLQIGDVRPFGPFNATIGNTDLDPFLSDNIDVAAEWYYDEGSFLAVTYFHKSVSDFIGTVTTEQPILDANGDPLTDPSARLVIIDAVTGEAIPATSIATDPIAVFDVTQSVNTNDANINGVEISLQHLFGDTGFGLQANYTYVDSDAEFDPDSLDQVEQSLIGLSDTANLVAFYENEKFSIRVAGNWRDDFLFATNQLRVTNEPVFFDSFIQVDASASYNVNEHFSVFLEALNLTGADQSQTGRFEDQFLFENDQKPRITFGVRATF
ncbi:MAG: TonB-dependent receptor [Hyphomonadaceae bacterium]